MYGDIKTAKDRLKNQKPVSTKTLSILAVLVFIALLGAMRTDYVLLTNNI